MLQLSLEVVDGLLSRGDPFVELVIAMLRMIAMSVLVCPQSVTAYIVNGSDTERETTWDTNAEGELASLAVLRDIGFRACRSVEVGEGH